MPLPVDTFGVTFTAKPANSVRGLGEEGLCTQTTQVPSHMFSIMDRMQYPE